MNVDLKYRVPLTGEYTAAVYECPFCGHDILEEFFNHICGFSESNTGMVAIIECPVCHEKYYSHASDGYYSCFLETISKGTNLHFKK